MKTDNNIDEIFSQILTVIPEIAKQIEHELDVRAVESKRLRKREAMKQYMKQVDLRDRLDEAIAIRQKVINQAKGEILSLQKKRKAVESEIANAAETLKSFE